ncbi:[bacterium]|nr:[FeFe] hydrogenase H-cluster radical SAM maturase HydG [bacterium]
HAEHLDKTYGIGPHTISVPRIEPAEGVPFSKNPPAQMDDTEFKKVIATLRLAVPYTGMMLSTRETPKLRREILDLGVSQISAASKTNPGGYHVHKDVTSQFESGDTRCMEDIIKELCENDFLPSFCTACYRVGRVGEKFMEHAKSGHIHTFCEPNALATFEEYLQDYGNDELKSLGEALIQSRIAKISDDKIKEITKKNIQAIKEGQRDLYL